MGWFDGTFRTTMEKIESEYPVRITEDLRTTTDYRRIALINGFAEGDFQFVLAAPDLNSDKVFYHTFLEDEAKKAKSFLTSFVESGYGMQAEEVDLIRHDADELFKYSYGEILTDRIQDQENLKLMLPETMKDSEVFVLPLKTFKYACPVCKNRTLKWRGWFDICTECGWEDDGTNDEDALTTPNGDYTIRTYRIKYMKLKQKNPNYKAFGPDDD